MIGFNGGLIGIPRNTSSDQSVPGVWDLEEQSDYASNTTGLEWPSVIVTHGTESSPYSSPKSISDQSSYSGFAWIKSPGMSAALLFEYKNNYYESKPWVCVFRSAFASTATINHIDKSIPMKGLLVQRDALDHRAAVYWNTTSSFSTTGTSGISADTGYSPRRVILGLAGGHGIYNTGQSACNWSSSTGAIGAGYDGSCGSFPNALRWGTGTAGNTYTNMSGTWSLWVYWE